MLNEIGRQLGQNLDLGLQGSASFASRVLWPPELAGERMFEFTDVPPHKRLRWFGATKNTQTLSPKVVEYLDRPRRGRPGVGDLGNGVLC